MPAQAPKQVPEIIVKAKRKHIRSNMERAKAESTRAHGELKRGGGDSNMSQLIGLALFVASIAAAISLIMSSFG